MLSPRNQGCKQFPAGFGIFVVMPVMHEMKPREGTCFTSGYVASAVVLKASWNARTTFKTSSNVGTSPKNIGPSIAS